MVPEKFWAYIIEDAAGRSLFIDTNGSVQPSSSIKPLKDHPKGWTDISIGFGTNQKYFSLNRSFTVPLNFVNDGAEIIRFYAYKGKGYESELYIHILRYNSEFINTDNTQGRFEREYRGKLDFSKMVDDPATGVTINTIEGGLLSYLNANDNVTYELPCDETNPDAIKVLFDGVKLFDKYNYKTTELELNFAGFVAIPIFYQNNEGDSVGVIHGSQDYDDFTESVTDYVHNSSNYLFSSVKPISVKVKGTLTITNVGGSGANQFAASFTTSLNNNHVAFPLTVVPVGTSSTFTFDLSINLAAGEKLFFLMAQPGFAQTIKFEASGFSVEFSSMNDASTAYALRPLDLLKQLVSKATNGKYTANSNFFTNNNKVVATSGPALRQFKDTSGNIRGILKASIQDWFTSYDPDYNIGFKVVDNVLWVEPKPDLYNDNSQIFDVSEVSDLKVSVATEYLANTMKTGAPVQEYNERNGRYEFNNTFEWKLPVTAIQKEINKVSKWREDCYGIEFIRGSLNNKDTTDNKADNEVFKVVISDIQDADGNFLLSRPSYSSISGLPAGMPITGPGAVFNTELSPKRKLLAWGNYLKSLLYQLPAEKVTFQTADKNKDLSTTLGSVTIKENADVVVSKFSAPLFLPYVLEFTTQVPYTFSKILSSLGTGNIKLSYKGNVLYCLPIGDMTAKPVNDEAQEWKLLVSPKTSLLTLLKLSYEALFIEFNDNALVMTTINPVHFVKYNYQLHAKYHHKEMFDDWAHNRNNQFAVQPSYKQKWQKTDEIRLQVVSAKLSQLSVKIYDCDAVLVDTIEMDITANPAVQPPYILLQAAIPLTDFVTGNYLLVLFSGSTPLLVSEWQTIDEKFEETVLIEYYHTRNKYGAYFQTWKPMIRVEAEFGNPTPKSTSTNYTDEPGNSEQLNGHTYWVRDFLIGNPYGVPEWMGLKLNTISLLNRVAYSGTRYTREEGEMETFKRNGYPFDYYKLELRPSTNEYSLSILDSAIEPLSPGAPVWTFDAQAFGQAPGVINVEIEEE